MYEKKLEYLKGLMSGLSMDPNTNEYKMFSAVIAVLDAMSVSLADAEEDISELEDNVDELEDELDGLDDLLDRFGDVLDDIDEDDEDDDEDDEDDGDSEYEITCPGCEHVFIVDEETIFKGEVSCPSCGEKLNFEIGGCGECDCGHCHDDEQE